MTMTEELLSKPAVHMFDTSGYNAFLSQYGLFNVSRAISIQHRDGRVEIAVDTAYYEYGGIYQEQMQAIVEHELAEIVAGVNSDPNPHLAGVIAEYNWIYDNFGGDGEYGLETYHARLCNLMGGINDTRNQALEEVLGVHA